MNRIDRLHAIIIQIQSKKVVTGQEIASRFGISLRTVYRDIRALEEAGVPIGAEAGLGYFIDDNYSLPPVMFTRDEASALLLGGKFISHFADKQVERNFQDALIKIKSILGTESKEWLSKLDDTVKVLDGNSVSTLPNDVFFQNIQNALVKQLIIKIEYFAQYKQQVDCRRVEPISLLYYAANWHLIAFCQLRGQYRDFRIDRIQKLQLTSEKYIRNLDKSFQEYIDAERDKMEMLEIILKCKIEAKMTLGDSKYWYGFISETQVGDSLYLKFLNANLNGFARWLISLNMYVEIEKPKALLIEVNSLIIDLNNKYLSQQ